MPTALPGQAAGHPDLRPESAPQLIRHVSRLLHTSKQIMAQTHLESLLGVAADAAREITTARLAVAAYAYREGSFTLSAASWAPGLDIGGPSLPSALSSLAATVYEKVLRSGLALRLTEADLAEAPGWWRLFEAATAGAHRGLLGAPLVGREGRIAGLILVVDGASGAFDAGEEIVLSHLAALTSLAAQQVEARTEAQALASRLEAVLSSVPDGLLVYDTQGDVEQLNATAQQMLGDSLADLALPIEERFARLHITQTDGRALRPGETPGARALRGETVHRQVLALHTDGQAMTVSVSATPVRDQAGQTRGAVVTFTDITEQAESRARLQQANEELSVQAEELEVQAEELHAQNEELARLAAELEVEHARLTAVLQQMPGGVIIAEAPSGRVLLSNDQVEHILRGPYRPAQDPAGYMQYATYYPDGRPYPDERAPLARALCDGEIVTGEEMIVIRGDGSRAVLSVSSRPVRDHSGRIVAGVVTFTDITQRKEMEEALVQARDQLELRVQERTADLSRANQALQYQAYLLANINDAIVATDANYRVTAWNRAAEALYGWSSDDAIGQPFSELVSLETRGLDVESLTRTIQQERRLVIELVQLRRDGSRLVIDARIIALTDPYGQITGYLAVCRDITERRHAEEALRSNEELLRQLAENVHEVFWITDGERRQTLYVNPAYEQIWGRPPQSLYDDPLSFLEGVHPDDLERVLRARQALPGQDFNEVYRVQHPDGSLRWISAHTFPIRNQAGEIYRVAGVAEDITEQVHAVQLLEERVDMRTRELSALLGVAHQLTSTLELEPLPGLILDALAQIVDYGGAAIYRLVEGGEQVEVLDYRGPRSRDEVLKLRFPIQGTVGLETVAAHGKPVLIPDTRADNDLARRWHASTHEVQKWLLSTARSWLAVPLVANGQLIGLLRLDHPEPGHFAAHHVDLALAFADHAAMALENARLYRQVETLAALEERQRLARDLHDAVSQTLFSASLIADVLPRVWEQSPTKGTASLQELQQLTRGAMAEMRTLLMELRPTALTNVELGLLLRHLTEASSAHAGYDIALTVEGPCQLPADIQVALYRIAQEALNNVTKHAEAHSASVRLRCEPLDGTDGVASVELSIVDDGRGFDSGLEKGGSLGLKIMHERVAAIGADLRIESEPGHGTQVTVTWRPAAQDEK